jgi:formylglycine-generating enzyme required for sulfatase activity
MVTYIIAILISTGISANELKITTVDNKSFNIPTNILKALPTIYDMVKDLGIYDESTNIINQKELMPLQKVSLSVLEPIIDILSAAQVGLHGQKMFETREIIKRYNLGQANQKAEKDAIKVVSSWVLLKKQAKDLFEIMAAANFLGSTAILDAAVDAFISAHMTTATSFHKLIPDIKSLIIRKITPQNFMVLIAANEEKDDGEVKDTPEEEDSFRIALNIHSPTDKAAEGETAKKKYKELFTSILGGFVRIPGGTYEIGSPPTEAKRFIDEDLHLVNLSSFYIMDAGVTQEVYAKIMGNNPSQFKEAKYCPHSFKEIEVNDQKIPVCADHPVEMVSYEDAVKFAERMNEIDPTHKYSLPTEAQLEVAYRGGTNTAYVTGRDDTIDLGYYVWYSVYSGSQGGQSYGIKSKWPNIYGIYRSSVSEWAKDWYKFNYAHFTGLDPQGPASGEGRVARGGSWDSNAQQHRSASREHFMPDIRSGYIGFRLVRR